MDARIAKKRVRKPTKKWIDRVCLLCRKEFKVMPSKVKAGHGNYCSVQCLPQNQKGKKGTCQEKEKNSNWKGRITANRYRYKLIETQRYPEKIKARDIVKKAKKSGKLIVQPCSICKNTDRIHAHHEDYNKPLEVIWLCSKCHHEKHQ